MHPSAAKSGPKPPRETRETPSIQSLERGLLILEAVGKSSEPVSLGHLAAVLGVDRSSAFRLANTLRRRGFLAHPSDSKEYVLGPSVWRLSRQYDWSKMLVKVAHDQLKRLAASTNETAHVAVREGRRALFIDHVTTSHVIAVAGQTGELSPLYCTAHGKALLSDFSEQDMAKLLGGKQLKPYTRNTVQNVRSLAAECEQVRATGVATDEAEYIEGVHCLAAPIRDRDGAVIASIGISAPAARMSRQVARESAVKVAAAADQIRELLESLNE